LPGKKQARQKRAKALVSEKIRVVVSEAIYDRLFISGDRMRILMFSVFEAGQPEKAVITIP